MVLSLVRKRRAGRKPRLGDARELRRTYANSPKPLATMTWRAANSSPDSSVTAKPAGRLSTRTTFPGSSCGTSFA